MKRPPLEAVRAYVRNNLTRAGITPSPGPHKDTPPTRPKTPAQARLERWRAAANDTARTIAEESGHVSTTAAWQPPEKITFAIRSTRKIAAALDAARPTDDNGHPIGPRTEKTGDKFGRWLFLCDPLTGAAEPVPEFQNRNFLPAVCLKNRKPIRRLLGYYFHTLQNAKTKKGFQPRCRMLVFSAGAKVEATGIRERVTKLCKKIKKIHEKLNTKFNGKFHFICRNIEIAGFYDAEKKILKRDTESGEIMFHIHSHVLLIQLEKIEPDAWKTYLKTIAAKARKIGHGQGRDAGQIRSIEEATKYVTDTDGLELLPPATLAEISKQMFRTKVLHLIGPALELSKKLKAEGKTPREPRNGKGWHTVKTGPGRAKDAKKTGYSKAPAPDVRAANQAAENALEDACRNHGTDSPQAAAAAAAPLPPLTPGEEPGRTLADTTRPQILALTRPSNMTRPEATPGLLIRCRPDQLSDTFDRWQESPHGRRTLELIAAGFQAHGNAGKLPTGTPGPYVIVHKTTIPAPNSETEKTTPEPDLETLMNLFPDHYGNTTNPTRNQPGHTGHETPASHTDTSGPRAPSRRLDNLTDTGHLIPWEWDTDQTRPRTAAKK